MAKVEQKEINIEQVVRYLSYTFDKSTKDIGKAERYIDSKPKKIVKTDGYRFQTEFCYLIDEIQRGPKCLIQKAISDCNDLIEQATLLKTVKDGKVASKQNPV